MKLFTLFMRYLLSVALLCSLSYGMNPPQTPSFVTEILHLTTQCINAESTHLESWTNNTENPFFTLQSKILSGYFITKNIDEATTAPTFLLLAPENRMLLANIDNMKIVEKGMSYHINKPLLRKFRMSVVMHNQLIKHELECIKQSLECSETTQVARTENVVYARELVGTSNPRLSYLLPQEYSIVRQLRKQRIDFQIGALTDENPSLNWLIEQQKLLKQYLDIQNQYIEINPLLSDQEKNIRYEKELEKTKLAIKKHRLKVKMQKTADIYHLDPHIERLQAHKDCVEKLQKISPTEKKATTIALISFVEKVLDYKNKDIQNVSCENLEQVIIELLDHLPTTQDYDQSIVINNTNSRLYEDIITVLKRCIFAFCSLEKKSSLEIPFNNFDIIVQCLAKIAWCSSRDTTKNIFLLQSCTNSYNKKLAHDINIIIHNIKNNTGRFKDMSLDKKIEIIHHYFSKDDVYPEYRKQAIEAAHATDAQATLEAEIAQKIQEQNIQLHEKQDTQVPPTEQLIINNPEQRTKREASSLYEKFATIITAPLRLLLYISDLLWFIYG